MGRKGRREAGKNKVWKDVEEENLIEIDGSAVVDLFDLFGCESIVVDADIVDETRESVV